MTDKRQLLELLEEKKKRLAFNKLAEFVPYEYQKEFINASGSFTTRFCMAGNRVGKSEVAAYEVVIHATGIYPDWWEGKKFDCPTRILCAGVSNTSMRDIMQEKLVGEPTNRSMWGSGMIPKDKLGSTARKAGIPDALSSVLVKHVTGGWSKISFISYESGKEAFMGTSSHFVNLDEEPPEDVYSQAIRAIVDTNGIIAITATPERGLTPLVNKFQQDKTGARYLQRVTWADCPHLTPEVQAKMLEELPPHEREMRSKGIPVFGSGLIYPLDLEEIVVDSFEVDAHWPQMCAIDFGYEHNAGWCRAAWDREADVIYIMDILLMKRTTPDLQVQEIRNKDGAWVPTAWPQDGLTAEKGSGIVLKTQYEGLYLLADPFKNPADPVTGKANNSVEAGLLAILQRMQNGKLKIMRHCEPLLEEMRIYHRKDGKIVKNNDDAVDAMRYCVQSMQHGQCSGFTFDAYIPHEHDGYFGNEMVAY